MSLPELVGYAGVALVLAAYLGLQAGALTSGGLAYSVLNAIGAVGILVSLWFYPNWPSIVIECAWLLISLFGLARYFMKNNKEI